MKLTKITLVAAFTFGALFTSSSALAADPSTDAKIIFDAGQVNPDGGISKPDDKDGNVIIPQPPTGDGDGNTKPSGSLAITHAPVIDFGNVEIKTGGAEYSSKAMSYKNVATGATEYMPNVLNVEDVRGTKGGWSVSVQGSDFVAGSKKLEGAYLTFKTGRKVFNSSENGPAAIIDSAKFDTQGELVLSPSPSDGSYATLPLLSAKAGNGAAQTSLVFDSKYEGTFTNPTSPTAYDANSKIDDISLVIPSNTVPEVSVQYTAKVTWTLSNTPI